MPLQQYEIDHYNQVRDISSECMVMLKSDGSFPLKKTEELALYGSGARHTLRHGSGGGIVEVRDFTTIEQGLDKAGFHLTTRDWLDAYDAVYENARNQYREGIRARVAAKGMAGLNALSEAMAEPVTDLPLQGEGDVAVYVLARISGEGADRQAIPGDIFLNKTEIRDILRCADRYKNFLLVLNVSGIVDLSPVVDRVKNILLLSQTGIAIGDAFADVLLGKTYPSGKLASTWAKWEDYSQIGDFGDRNDTRYKEGIYVGYRYFDTLGKTPIFPFGYGLGYTSFDLKAGRPTLEKTVVTIPVSSKNTGMNRGKEVVQLYVSVPEGILDQPYQTLAAFQKTRELNAGETDTVNLTVDLRQLASYDAKSSARILEKGEYLLLVGNSSRNTKIVGSIILDQTVIVEHLRHVGGFPDFQDWKPEKSQRVFHDRAQRDERVILPLASSMIVPFAHQDPKPDDDAIAFAKTLTDEELAHLCTGNYASGNVSVGGGLGSTRVPGAAGETTTRFIDRGIPHLVMSDGPAGIHINREYGVDEKGSYSLVSKESKAILELVTDEVKEILLKMFPDAAETNRKGAIVHQYCTAIPIETALAQSWNPDVCQICGELVAREMEIFGIHFFLAPGLNTHRNPLCGRNYEYFSEDPLISGKMAAGVVRGIQKSQKRGATLKHFVCNEQETNRLYSNSQVSERALREIYMRPFEIAIKEASPLGVMSSYNLLNGEHTSQRVDLMETVLREEWGYQGIVMSDWVGFTTISDDKNKYPRACASGAIKAGNDIMMPGYIGHYEDIMNALNNPQAKYPLSRANLEKCASRMISITWRIAGKPELQRVK